MHELRAFALDPHPAIPALPGERWIVLDTIDGAPIPGRLETAPIFGSRNAAELYIEVDHAVPEAIPEETIALIERHFAQGGVAADFAERNSA